MNTDILIRLGACAGVLVLMASWEVLAPRRRLGTSKLRRWTDNLTVVALNTMVVRLVFGTGAVGAAIVVTGHGWGLLNRVSWPLWFEVAMTMQGCSGEEWALKAYRAYKECLMGRPTDQTALCGETVGYEE